MLENTEGTMQKGNPEKLATKGTQDTGQQFLSIALVYCPFGIL
jgi:hypothetical protein